MKYVFVFILSLSRLFASDFEDLQKSIKEVEDIILQEESIVQAYERYIVEKKDIPILENLLHKDYLGENFAHESDFFKNFSLPGQALKYQKKYSLSYLLKENNQNENVHYESMKNLYRSNKLRKSTFYFKYKNKKNIHFILKNDFALNLYDLIFEQKAALLDCSDLTSGKYCLNKEHIFMYKNASKEEKDLLLFYHKSKFKTGPIIINDKESTYLTEKEFLHLPIGALLIDFKGQKLVKTKDNIRLLK